MLKPLLISTALALAALLAAVAVVFTLDMQRAYARIEGRSTVIASPFGDIEYTDSGPKQSGAPVVLVVHGSGGGFDQGELLARVALGESFRVITPSRFGYLRSTFHPGATFDEQAHAFAFLLDHLKLDRVAVVAFSHGGPSALLFAVLHPRRVFSLTLLSAGVASSASAAAPEQAQADAQGDALRAIFAQDIRYWAITTFLRTRFLAIMGADAEITAHRTPEQGRLTDELIDGMNPVSRRAAGAAFDNEARMPNERIAAIRAPTLVLHARDDSLQIFRHAEFAAAQIPGARLVTFDRGGHLLLAVEQARVRELTTQHVLNHAGPAPGH
jgi:pimeloyl-ACP methyl ester carboxylesterase